MDRPGIEVRPIRQLDGENKFNEVYLTDVRVTSADLLGATGDGWKVGLSVLGSERRMLGSVAIGLKNELWRLREQVRRKRRDHARFRERWVAVYTRVELLRWTWFRFLSEAGAGGGDIDPRTSVLKLVSSELQQRSRRLARDALGGAWARRSRNTRGGGSTFLGAHGATIAGGTSEIQRNILGERVLGLPR